MMRKKTWGAIALSVLLALSAVMLFACADKGGGGTAGGENYIDYTPQTSPGGDQFDYDGNYAPPELEMDGKADDDVWKVTPVLATYGKNDNAVTVKVFRGEKALFFFFDVADNNLLTSGVTNDDKVTVGDSVELYLDTKADGGNYPQSDDYQINLGIHGKTRIMQGAGGKWGGWNGLVDYEVDLKGGTLNDDTANDTGYSVEVMVPYAQIGIEKNDTIGIAFGQVDKTGSADGLWYGWKYKGVLVEPQTINNYIFLDKDGNLTSRDEQSEVVIPDEVSATKVTSGKRNSDDWLYFYLFMKHTDSGVTLTAYTTRAILDEEFLLLYLDFGTDTTSTGWAYGPTDYQIKLYGDCNAFYRKSKDPWWRTDHNSADKLTAVKTENEGLYCYSFTIDYATFGYTAEETIGFAVLQGAKDNVNNYDIRNDNSFYYDGASTGDVAVQTTFLRLAADDTLYIAAGNGADHNPATATLAELKINGVAVDGFESGKFTGYTYEFDNGVTPTAAMVTYAATNGASGTALSIDETAKTISVQVTSPNKKSTNTYVIAYTNAAPDAASKDATLSSLTIEGESVKDFAASQTKYVYNAAFDADISALRVEAVTNHERANAAVTISEDGKTIIITVTAEDTAVSTKYYVDINGMPPAAVVEGKSADGWFLTHVDVTRNAAGTTFDFYTSRELATNEFALLYLDFGTDTKSTGWAQGETDYQVKVYGTKKAYYRKTADPWWKTETSDANKDVTVTQGIAGVYRYSFVLDYATFGYAAEDIFGFAVLQATDSNENYGLKNDGCRLNGTAIGDTAMQTNFIRCDETGELYKKDSNTPQVKVDKETLTKGYAINFADPADGCGGSADDIYAKLDRSDAAGIQFDMIGFGELKAGEFITMVLHTAADKGGWALDATDIMIKITSDGTMYYKSGLATFWTWQNIKDTDSKFAAKASIAQKTGYFTVKFTLPYAELTGIDETTAFSMLLTECADNGENKDMNLYNANPVDNYCQLNGSGIGDPANQARYIRVAADGSLSLKTE